MMRALHGLAIVILINACLLPNGRAGPNEQGIAPRRNYVVNNVGALDALIRLGQLYERPMGIVSGDRKIATTQVSVRTAQATTQEAMAALMRQLPEYEWREDRGVIVVQPRVVPPVAKKMLRTVISKFAAGDSSTEQLSALLWWELQRTVDPESARRGYWGIGHDYVRIGPVDLTNVTIDQMLTEIVRRRGSAAWVVPPPPVTLKGAPRDRLWSIVIYASPPQPLDQLCCLNQEYFR